MEIAILLVLLVSLFVCLQFLGVLNPNKQTQPCAVFTRRTKSTTVYKCPQTNEKFKF